MENIEDYISDDISEVERMILELSILNGDNVNYIKFELDYNKYNINDVDNSEDKYWKKWVGYGYSGRTDWDIKEYIRGLQNQQINVSKKIDYLREELDGINNNTKSIKDRNVKFVTDKFTGTSKLLINYIKNTINNTTLLEINKSVELYNSIIKIIPKIFTFIGNDINYEEWKIDIYKGVKSIVDDISIILETIDEDDKLNLYVSFISLHDSIKDECSNLNYNLLKRKEESKESKLFSLSINNEDKIKEIKKEYSDMISQYQTEMFKDFSFDSNHRFFKKIKNNESINKNQKRVLIDLSSLKKNLPNNWDTSVILKSSQKNINLVTFIITGPKDTPYHNGIYEFHGYFPPNYPDKEPEILLDTTGNGTVRFNPNLYNCGKVCLSLLGTWNG